MDQDEGKKEGIQATSHQKAGIDDEDDEEDVKPLDEDSETYYSQHKEDADEILYGESAEFEFVPGPKHHVEDLKLDDVLRQKERDLKAKVKGKEEARKKQQGSTRVVFGSCQDRPILPTVFPRNRIGEECYYRSRFPVGPGSYDIGHLTSSLYKQEKISSTNAKGWGFGLLTDPRFGKSHRDITPDPCRYQPDNSGVRKFKPCKYPFGICSERFKPIKSITPGPGTYEHEMHVGRQVRLQQCFGSTPPSLKSKGKRHKFKDSERREKRQEQYLELYCTT